MAQRNSWAGAEGWMVLDRHSPAAAPRAGSGPAKAHAGLGARPECPAVGDRTGMASVPPRDREKLLQIHHSLQSRHCPASHPSQDHAWIITR